MDDSIELLERPLVTRPTNGFSPLPLKFTDQSAIDIANKIIYVTRRVAGDPLFLSWQATNKMNGHAFQMQICDMDELAKMRLGGLRAEDAMDDEQHFKNQAIATITKAAAYGCSDIHYMLRGTHTEIQFVINGGLRVFDRATQEEGEKLTRSIYQGLAKVRESSFQPMDFQHAQIAGEDLPPVAGLTSVRIVRGPAYPADKGGAFMTLRLQYNAGVRRNKPDLPLLASPRKPSGQLLLNTMGYSQKQVDDLMRLIDAPSGIVIFTGPTGSGKTTAMYECLKESARQKPHRRLVTAEDPVEYPMDWAVQLAITGGRNDKETGELFAERIRVMLRMAPNNILVGELRGPEVACAALEAAVTGHAVLTTLHTTDPFLCVERLELMDSERLNRKVFCDHKIIRGIVAQRLVPRLCEHCSIPLSSAPGVLNELMLQDLRTWGDLSNVRIQGTGCEHCGSDGSTGRFAVPEIIVTDADLMADYINHGSDTARQNYKRKHGHKSMLELSIEYVLQGTVDPRAVEEKVDLIVAKESV